MAYDPWTGFSVSLDRVVEQLNALEGRSVPGDEMTVRSQYAQMYATVACAHALGASGRSWRRTRSGGTS